MALKDDIATHRSGSAGSTRAKIAEHKRKQGIVQQMRADQRAEVAALDPTEGMSTAELTAAGYISGLKNVGQSVGNIVGLVSDEDLMAAKELDAPLGDTTAGSVGQFAGDVAALAPLGAIGGAAKLAKLSGKLPKALQALTSRAAAATAEGAAGGAILASPGQRGAGAGQGAALGLTLNKLFQGLGRVGRRGISKPTESAKKLAEAVEYKTGKEPFIPLAMAADETADALSAKGKAIGDFASLLPSARSKLTKQVSELEDAVFETNLRQSFGKVKGEQAVGIFKETGDVQKALDRTVGAKPTPLQQSLEAAAAGSVRGKYTPRNLINAVEKQARAAGRDVSTVPLRETANLAEDVLSQPLGISNVASREAYHKASSVVDKLFRGTLDLVPGLGPALGSKSLQQFILGSTKWQRALQKAVDSKNGQRVYSVLSGIRRAMSAQPQLQDESSDFVTMLPQTMGAGNG